MAPKPLWRNAVSTLLLGTRGSDLARAQAHIVSGLLARAHPDLEIELRILSSEGDERSDRDLTDPGTPGKGLFTKWLDEALLRNEIRLAVHSLKDLPVDLICGLALGAIPERANPSEVLVSKHPGGLAGLPPRARVATSSVRRVRFLRHIRPDLVPVSIRGNIPTRLEKLCGMDGLDGLILAKAGLDRLGPQTVPEGLTVTVEPEILPAPGQGALGVVCRADDAEVLHLLTAIHHENTARCVHAERDLLRTLGGGCAAPLGALAEIRNGQLALRSMGFEDLP